MNGELAAGDRVGGHVLVAPVGRGGMATVWRARRDDGAEVALKVLAPERAAMAASAERFVREARACAALQHPSIVRVLGAGRDEDRLWLAMELLAGEDLATRARRAPLTPAEAAETLARVADALDHAHTRGLLHRDVKGANVLLCDDGGVKLVDFGIARDGRAETLTATGELLGTLTHLAPELCRGERATPATDLYALGVTLFEAVTGHGPFAGNAVSLVMHHARSAPPRVRTVNPAVPERLDDLIDRLLAKDPAARPQRAAEVRDALRTMRATAAPASADAQRITAALDALQAALAAQTRAQHEAEAAVGAARSEAREALGALQRTASAWVGAGGALAPVSAAEARWVAARDALATRGEAHRAATAAREDLEFQVRTLRGRLAAEGS
ncbi:MAG: serine/threonine-protein kinase [Polyangiales bacterium]